MKTGDTLLEKASICFMNRYPIHYRNLHPPRDYMKRRITA